MVRFCNKCNRAVDDLDKFCRSCGQSTNDSIDYHTYYRLSIKDENEPLLWFMKGVDIAFRQEIKEINETVDRMYQKLFPPSVGELREELDKVFDRKEEKEEKPVEKLPEKKEEHKEEKPIEKPPEIEPEKKEEHKEEKPVEKSPEIEPGKKEEHKEEKPVEKSPEIEPGKKEEHKEEKPVEKSPEIEPGKKEEHKEEMLVEKPLEKEEERVEENIVDPNIDDHNIISTKELLENKGLNDKLLIESSEEKENWPWPEEGTDKGIGKGQGEAEVPKEVNDKLGVLLQEDEGQRQAVQYLINKYNKNKGKKVGDTVNNNKSDDKSSADTNTGSSIAIVPSEDVVRIGRARGKGKEKGEPYKMYDVAIYPFIPDILKSIEGSKDGMIRVRLQDIAKKMGEKFVDKKPVTIYTGLKYTLFDHDIVIEMGSLKAVDPVTKQNVKILKMRMKNPDDMLPFSMLQRRGDIE